MMETGILLLAAGEGRRMGRPKQLIHLEGEELIVTMVKRLLTLNAHQLTVVLGAHFPSISPLLSPYPLDIHHHHGWAEGMGSSIRAGFLHLSSIHSPDRILLCLVDQVLLLPSHYNKLLEASDKAPSSIVAAHYQGRPGAPMVFPRPHFHLLEQARGDEGIRKRIRRQLENITLVDLPEAAYDWDRPEDLPLP